MLFVWHSNSWICPGLQITLVETSPVTIHSYYLDIHNSFHKIIKDILNCFWISIVQAFGTPKLNYGYT